MRNKGYNLLLMRSRNMSYCSCAAGVLLTAQAQKGYDFVLMRSRGGITYCSCAVGI